MKTCRNCGAANAAEDRFCAKCGAVLPQDEDQPSRGTMSGSSASQPEPIAPQAPGQPSSGAPQPVFGKSDPPSSGDDPYLEPGGEYYAQPPTGHYGRQPGAGPDQDQVGSYGQPPGPYGQQPPGPYGQPNEPYGQQQPYGQPSYGQPGQQYGQPGGPYAQQQPAAENPYGDSSPPWYATGSATGSPSFPPPTSRRGRSAWKTALLIIVGLILLACIGTVIFAATPYGGGQLERLGTWAAEESTKQAGGN